MHLLKEAREATQGSTRGRRGQSTREEEHHNRVGEKTPEDGCSEAGTKKTQTTTLHRPHSNLPGGGWRSSEHLTFERDLHAFHILREESVERAV
jgi:hypothetical protein